MDKYDKPKKRSDCKNGPRPCPWVGCKWNMALDVTSSGSIVGPRRPGGGISNSPLRVNPRKWSECDRKWKIVEQSIIDYLDHISESGETNCSLDLCDGDGMTLTSVGSTIGVTRERARQIEDRSIRICRESIDGSFADWIGN